MKALITTLGMKQADELGMILPHEHVFVDLRRWDQPGYAEAAAADVVALMAPELERARAAGVTAIVECSTGGVGRRADLDAAVSAAASFPLVLPTGFYREPWIPDWVHRAGEDELTDHMLSELQGEVDASGVSAAWIKLSAGDDGMTDTERRVLRSASRAAKATGALVGSHTVRGSVALEQLGVVEGAGCGPARFLWIHAQAEADFSLHLEMARRGAWVEYDAIGAGPPDSVYVDWIKRMIDAGFGGRVLLSHDRGWYDPSLPRGGIPRPFTYISTTFLPKLREAGVPEQLIAQMTVSSPFDAFAR